MHFDVDTSCTNHQFEGLYSQCVNIYIHSLLQETHYFKGPMNIWGAFMLLKVNSGSSLAANAGHISIFHGLQIKECIQGYCNYTGVKSLNSYKILYLAIKMFRWEYSALLQLKNSCRTAGFSHPSQSYVIRYVFLHAINITYTS